MHLLDQEPHSFVAIDATALAWDALCGATAEARLQEDERKRLEAQRENSKDNIPLVLEISDYEHNEYDTQMPAFSKKLANISSLAANRYYDARSASTLSDFNG